MGVSLLDSHEGARGGWALLFCKCSVLSTHAAIWDSGFLHKNALNWTLSSSQVARCFLPQPCQFMPFKALGQFIKVDEGICIKLFVIFCYFPFNIVLPAMVFFLIPCLGRLCFFSLFLLIDLDEVLSVLFVTSRHWLLLPCESSGSWLP